MLSWWPAPFKPTAARESSALHDPLTISGSFSNLASSNSFLALALRRSRLRGTAPHSAGVACAGRVGRGRVERAAASDTHHILPLSSVHTNKLVTRRISRYLRGRAAC